MKQFLRFQVFLLLLLGILATSCRSSGSETETTTADATTTGAAVGTTTIYLVRHAEKETSDPKDEDPDLTTAGRIRAEALRTLLHDEKIDALYATKYNRTKNTLKPLADERNLEVVQYSAHDFDGLKAKVLKEHAGKTVVVAGHSNTLLPMVEAFGAKKPIADISESEYFYLFKIMVDQNQKATVEMSRFGNLSYQ